MGYLNARAVLPMPLRIFYYLALAVYHCKKKADKDDRNDEEYYKLLDELECRKRAVDKEEAIEDKDINWQRDLTNVAKATEVRLNKSILGRIDNNYCSMLTC